MPFCPITSAAFGACARACSRAVFHSYKSSDVCTLRVNARPSRPSGKSTVNSFLSSLTTTLQKLFKSMPPKVRLTSPPRCGEILTGSFLRKTKDVRVRMNQRFFQDFQPSPANEMNSGPLLKTLLEVPTRGRSNAASEADISMNQSKVKVMAAGRSQS
nr:hypothetical protein Iba_chr08aCG1420 [Ipomoea batatas]GME04099.1 hypothetical protein Iba_scaffold1536CG0580 [Ipomoea batatas]